MGRKQGHTGTAELIGKAWESEPGQGRRLPSGQTSIPSLSPISQATLLSPVSTSSFLLVRGSPLPSTTPWPTSQAAKSPWSHLSLPPSIPPSPIIPSSTRPPPSPHPSISNALPYALGSCISRTSRTGSPSPPNQTPPGVPLTL